MEHRDAVDLARRLAESQHGVVARRQLIEHGLGEERVRTWVRQGRLVQRHRGVYTLGHRLLSREGRWMAAVLAGGESAALSHRSAAALWGLRPGGTASIDVTVADNGLRSPRDGITPHRSSLALSSFVTTRDGIPVTTVAWTLLDLAATLRPYELRRAVEESERQELFDLRAVSEALEADPGRPGSPALLALLADMKDHGVTRTRSDVEAAMLQICIDHGLPRPEVNRYDNGREVDFRWPEQRLIVEVDGWQFHRSRRAFVTDRARDRAALATGWRVARFPANEVIVQPAVVAGELRRLLGGSTA
jgi:very-short-patch-repair endonuclease